jgi:SAM-dependent methyltransferase
MGRRAAQKTALVESQETSLIEPYQSQFAELVRRGAGTQDIHDARVESDYTLTVPAYDALVEREIGRVALHQASLCPLLEKFIGKVDNVLDVGCSTGGTAVAVALSPILQPTQVIGLDPNQLSLEAARVRALGYELSPARLSFQHITPGESLPFADGSFHLTLCVSVLEYVSTLEGRRQLAEEIHRVTRRGGYIFLATPNPFRFRDYHTKRWFGDFIRREGYPWSCTPRQLRKLFRGCVRVPLSAYLVRQAIKKLKIPSSLVPSLLCAAMGWTLPWQKLLFRKRV